MLIGTNFYVLKLAIHYTTSSKSYTFKFLTEKQKKTHLWEACSVNTSSKKAISASCISG